MKDAMRLVYTVTPMSLEEAETFGLGEAERRSLIRMDSGKVNIAPPMHEAKWFRLIGVPLGNCTELYPNGDNVQTVEPWMPPDAWAGLTNLIINQILNDIEAGLPDGNKYSDGPNVTDRAAWRVVTKHSPDTSERAARQVVKTWVKSGLLVGCEYENPATRKTVKGLRVDNTGRLSMRIKRVEKLEQALGGGRRLIVCTVRDGHEGEDRARALEDAGGSRTLCAESAVYSVMRVMHSYNPLKGLSR